MFGSCIECPGGFSEGRGYFAMAFVAKLRESFSLSKKRQFVKAGNLLPVSCKRIRGGAAAMGGGKATALVKN